MRPSTRWVISSPKYSWNGIEIDERVFDDVVQQTGGDGYFVEFHIGENIGDFEGMHQIRFARGSLLAFMLAGRKEIGAPQQIQISLRVIAGNLLDNVFDSNH